jgi:hypothetical protein
VPPTIDLDAAAAELDRLATEWRAAGYEVGRPSWRDQGEGWPPKLKTDRAAAVQPDSIGIAVRRGLQEGEVILFDGAWCDVIFWSGHPSDEPFVDAPGYPEGLTLDEYVRVLETFIGRFS